MVYNNYLNTGAMMSLLGIFDKLGDAMIYFTQELQVTSYKLRVTSYRLRVTATNWEMIYTLCRS